ncbi:MAG: bifunctional rhamnulose-1-phosphate aldolase/short-chain dehydrogenase [Armatimonadetes bacterium]|nr:bifunctional rhamnulose-1-phosphate aldolase/short-chain dehydrogenase [Armatimonadota bacterium]
MLNRWNSSESNGLDPLGLLVYQSRLIGAEESLVLWGGGNTSLKIVETDFRGRSCLILRVKGSGSDMKVIERRHFSGVRMDDVLSLRDRDDMSDEEMVDYLAHTLTDPSAPRPSIETLLHAFVESASVFHSHSDSIVALTNTDRGVESVVDCYGDSVITIPYLRPGFRLSKEVADAIDRSPHCGGLILMNHGLITWGKSCEESYNRHIELVSQAENWLAEQGRGKTVFGTVAIQPLSDERRHAAAARFAPLVRGALCRNARCILRYDDSPNVLDFVNSERAAQLSQIGPATPDHLLHTKQFPLYLPIDESTLNDAKRFKQILTDELDRYENRYREYTAKHRSSSDPQLNPAPRVVLVPGIGIWTVGKDIRSATISRDIYRHTIQVIRAAEGHGAYRSLNENEIYAVEYWPLELYKLSHAPLEKPLARRIALITGGVGGIGRSIAETFAANGALVAVADLNYADCEKVADDLQKRYGKDTAIGLAMDVTDERSTKQAISRLMLVYGGLDILVSNAGIARTGRIDELKLEDWEQSLAVNATGHFLVAREVVRVFREQGIGGNIIFNVTKNVLAAGAEFGAYSASKAAELQLARVLAIENGQYGIRVNIINPDAVFSAGLWSPEIKAQRAKAQGIEVADLEEHYRKRNLLQVKVTAEDVSEAALWLASDRSAKTTGCIIPVDGGLREAFPR